MSIAIECQIHILILPCVLSTQKVRWSWMLTIAHAATEHSLCCEQRSGQNTLEVDKNTLSRRPNSSNVSQMTINRMRWVSNAIEYRFKYVQGPTWMRTHQCINHVNDSSCQMIGMCWIEWMSMARLVLIGMDVHVSDYAELNGCSCIGIYGMEILHISDNQFACRRGIKHIFENR